MRVKSKALIGILFFVMGYSSLPNQVENSTPNPKSDEIKSKELAEAANANDLKAIASMCGDEHNINACIWLKNRCEINKDASSCEKMSDITPGLGSEYLRYINLACDYGSPSACTVLKNRKPETELERAQREALEKKEDEKRIDEANQAEAALIEERKKNSPPAAGCSETPQQAICRIRNCHGKDPKYVADAYVECSDNIHTAYRLGRFWYFFRSDGAYMIMDHANYKGPCLSRAFIYPELKGWFICN